MKNLSETEIPRDNEKWQQQKTRFPRTHRLVLTLLKYHIIGGDKWWM
jgi:hypothetical protein